MTNFSLNKGSEKFTVQGTDESDADDGHKRSAESVFLEIEKRGLNIAEIKEDIK